MLHIYIFNSHQYDSMMGLNLGYIAQVTSFEWGKGWSANGVTADFPLESSWKFHGNMLHMQQVVSWCQEATSTHWAKSSKKAWLQKFMRCSMVQQCSLFIAKDHHHGLSGNLCSGAAIALRLMTFTTLLDFHQPIWMFQRWNSWRDRSPSHLRSAGLTAVKRAQETWHHDMWKQQTWPWWWNQNWMLRLPSSNIDNGKPRFCRSAS